MRSCIGQRYEKIMLYGTDARPASRTAENKLRGGGKYAKRDEHRSQHSWSTASGLLELCTLGVFLRSFLDLEERVKSEVR